MKLQNIQANLKAPKNQFNSFAKYKYRSCEDILEALKSVMVAEKCYLIITDEIVVIGDRYYVKATANLYDSENDKQIGISSAFAREPLSKKGSDESQITGAASSYARKYALNGLFCIDDSKDADHDDGKATGEAKKILPKKPTAEQDKILDKICTVLETHTSNPVVKSKVAALFLSEAGKYPSNPDLIKEAAQWLIGLEKESEWIKQAKKGQKTSGKPPEEPVSGQTSSDPSHSTKTDPKGQQELPQMTEDNKKFMTQLKNLLIEQAVYSNLLFDKRDFTKVEKEKLQDVVWIVLNRWPKSKDDVLVCMKAIKAEDVIDE